MFKLILWRSTCRYAAAFGVLAIGTVAFSAAAAATTLPLFPFIATPPVQSAPPAAQAAPEENRAGAIELPPRLRRQVVNYPTSEARGTVIIDTPNTYLYYVLGG